MPIVNDTDTVMRVKIIKTDTNIVEPGLKYPQSFCKEMESAWANYLKNNPKFKKEFEFDSDSTEHYVSFRFDIDTTGKIVNWSYADYNSKIQSVYYQIFRDIFLRTRWTCGYVKSKSGNKKITVSSSSGFSILSKTIHSMEIKDSKTMETFYKCF